MRLHDELYFEIHAAGNKSDVQRFVEFLLSGDLDDFFEKNKNGQFVNSSKKILPIDLWSIGSIFIFG